MKAARIIGVILGILMLQACAARPTLKIDLVSANERTPQPTFSTVNIAGGQPMGSCDQVRFYDVTEECRMPHCPVIWNLVLPQGSKPTKLTYGSLPGFGSMTIVPPHVLQANHRYEAIWDQRTQQADHCYGKVPFLITSNGQVLITGENK